MDMSALLSGALQLAVTVAVGVIGFFLKRTMTAIDRCLEDKADKDDTRKALEKLDAEVRSIKDNYLTKDDFYREQAKTDRKLDTIIDILMKRRDT